VSMKILAGILTIMLLGIAATAYLGIRSRQSSATTVHQSHQATTTGMATPTPVSHVKSARDDPMRAVDAAAAALNQLRQSVLQDKRARWATVKSLVHPKSRRKVFSLLNRDTERKGQTAPIWEQWGYTSALVAYVRSHYQVNTKAFRVMNFRPGQARITLYVVLSWLPEGEDSDPNSIQDLRIETMRWKNNKWLFVRETRPPVGQRPDLRGSADLNFDEIASLYEHYLKGFQKYPPPKAAS
jgi:hypothetical protein